MKINFKQIWILFFLYIVENSYALEIIRDPIFEDYFVDISNDLKLEIIDVYLIKDKSANAFVIEDHIYFTTGLLDKINNEETLKSIYLHEYGHIINNHFQSKKIKIQQSNSDSAFYDLFSVGLAVISRNVNIGIGSSITLNSNLISEISRHSVNFEIEADSFMVNQIKINQINTLELITFLKEISDPNSLYFSTHPRTNDRINYLEKLNYKKQTNSSKFEWIKAKYSKNSNNEIYNIFFEDLEKGIFNKDKKLKKINKLLLKYEAFKKGIFINGWEDQFENLLNINNNSFLKIEYINYLLDNNLEKKYYIIDKFKFNKELMSEYFYYYLYGKYYNKINNENLSNFYFCQFYKAINSKNKADFFCENYDIKYIPALEKSYAIFK